MLKPIRPNRQINKLTSVQEGPEGGSGPYRVPRPIYRVQEYSLLVENSFKRKHRLVYTARYRAHAVKVRR